MHFCRTFESLQILEINMKRVIDSNIRLLIRKDKHLNSLSHRPLIISTSRFSTKSFYEFGLQFWKFTQPHFGQEISEQKTEIDFIFFDLKNFDEFWIPAITWHFSKIISCSRNEMSSATIENNFLTTIGFVKLDFCLSWRFKPLFQSELQFCSVCKMN